MDLSIPANSQRGLQGLSGTPINTRIPTSQPIFALCFWLALPARIVPGHSEICRSGSMKDLRAGPITLQEL